jgi:hypothetical protein
VGRVAEASGDVAIDGATVWAFRVGSWIPARGWGYLLQFNGLRDLVTTLKDNRLEGKVSQLGIVAHGNVVGQVQLDRALTVETLPQFSAELAMLSEYLKPNAWVTFYSCIAAKAIEGSAFLASLSTYLRGRTIVGFVLYGFIAPGWNDAGVVKASETMNAKVAMDPSQHATHGFLDPWCRFAKRAKDGRIIHISYLEQGNRPGFTCANPACPGHNDPHQFCDGW